MPAITGINHIDSLLEGETVRLNAGSPMGTPVEVTYAFPWSPPAGADMYDAYGFERMPEPLQEAVRDALDLWAEVANLTFTEVETGGQINFALNDQGNGSAGYAYLPFDGVPGSMYLNKTWPVMFDQAPGTYGNDATIHEIGHLLGLRHPGDYNGTESGGQGPGPFLPSATDNQGYAIMAYAPPESGLLPHTPMVYDIAAVQYLYGANTTTRTGDDVYVFTDTPALRAIWDAGGVDTLDASSLTGAVRIDLEAGAYSDIADENTLGIAYGVTIENALGGAAGDRLSGNAADNLLFGNAGADSLSGGDGDDVLYGNWAADVLRGGVGADTLFGGQDGDDINGGDGNDVVYGNRGDDHVYDNFGFDTIFGGQGDDTILGGRKDDVIVGGLGDDWLCGDGFGSEEGVGGYDLLTGGAGADTFAFGDVAMDDTITDFDGAAGDRIRILANATVTVSAAADGSTVLTFSTIGSVQLAGVPPLAFRPEWVVTA
ncbi:M10 family metallopeptidase C-terminal domain-containing protein [Azospirillum sp. A39]|uniref:M10 family metallopeptidase C-terminal domain-containing protein n=1 Tax=Azospirillum sp. A39 TaxID=3462279 RepID=UPI0040462643